MDQPGEPRYDIGVRYVELPPPELAPIEIVCVASVAGMGIRDAKRGAIRTITVGEGATAETVRCIVRER